MQTELSKTIENLKEQIAALLKSIGGKVKRHDHKTDNWGKAGDLNYVLDRLREIDEFLG